MNLIFTARPHRRITMSARFRDKQTSLMTQFGIPSCMARVRYRAHVRGSILEYSAEHPPPVTLGTAVSAEVVWRKLERVTAEE